MSTCDSPSVLFTLDCITSHRWLTACYSLWLGCVALTALAACYKLARPVSQLCAYACTQALPADSTNKPPAAPVLSLSKRDVGKSRNNASAPVIAIPAQNTAQQPATQPVKAPNKSQSFSVNNRPQQGSNDAAHNNRRASFSLHTTLEVPTAQELQRQRNNLPEPSRSRAVNVVAAELAQPEVSRTRIPSLSAFYAASRTRLGELAAGSLGLSIVHQLWFQYSMGVLCFSALHATAAILYLSSSRLIAVHYAPTILWCIAQAIVTAISAVFVYHHFKFAFKM